MPVRTASIPLTTISLLVVCGVIAFQFVVKPVLAERKSNACVLQIQNKYEKAWCDDHRGTDGHCQGLPVAPTWRSEQSFYDELRKEKEFCLKQYE